MTFVPPRLTSFLLSVIFGPVDSSPFPSPPPRLLAPPRADGRVACPIRGCRAYWTCDDEVVHHGPFLPSPLRLAPPKLGHHFLLILSPLRIRFHDGLSERLPAGDPYTLLANVVKFFPVLAMLSVLM